MHIAIIGAGFTGLTAAYELQKSNIDVTIYEKESEPGGLAIGYKKEKWDWSLEKHYHHIFTSDTAIRELAKDIGINFQFYRPNTSSLVDSEIFQLDSPLKVLEFPKLNISERLRMGMVLAYLRYVADWQNLEQYKAHEWLAQNMGKKAYQMLWEPLMISKFGPYYKDISLAWFWARVKARSPQLGYPEGGFQHMVEVLAEKIEERGGVIRYSTPTHKLAKKGDKTVVKINGEQYEYDAVLVTVPNILFSKMTPGLPDRYHEKLLSFEGIGAVNMVFELSEPFFDSDVYWLSICEKEYPFLAVVEHTNLVDKSHYNNRHIVYVGNYLTHDHEYFSKSPEELLEIYDPYLKKLNPKYKSTVKDVTVFKVPFAQPIVTKQFSEKILPYDTPIENMYLANMQQVYPWDRGTNYAVDKGLEVARHIVKKYKP